MTHRFGFLCAAALSTLSMPALADDIVVVELFTSQGCSSCPPADRMLGELAGRDNIIALALHVDYWDYIGWADTFADPAFTQRQHDYGRAAGSTVVYTPQIVVDGQSHVIGTRSMEVADTISLHRDAPNPVSVRVAGGSDGWQVSADWVGDGQPPAMTVQLVTYSPSEDVEIAYGENAGLSTTYHNVVRSWQVVSEWSGASEFQAQVSRLADLPHVIIVQAAESGPIFGAALLD